MMSLKFKIVWVLSIIVISVLCGTPAMLLSFYGLGRAYVLATIFPPNYPGKQLSSQDTGGGSGGIWVQKIYHTNDSQDKVLSFMETHMPGFALVESEDPLRNALIYGNSTCAYETLLGEYLYRRGYYPCISLSIYPDEEIPSETLIEVFEWYPDQ